MNYYIIMKEWFIRFIEEEEQRKGYFIRILKYLLGQKLHSLTFKFKSFNFVLQIVTSQ